MKFKRSLKITAGVVLLTVVTVVGAVSVRLDWWEPRPDRKEGVFSFSDDFESTSTFLELFPKDMSRWHNRQLEPETNAVELTTEAAHSGQRSLKCFSGVKRGNVTSKADVERGGLHFVKGDHVWSQCWFLLKGGASGELVFLWDLEASRKWQSPGRRLFIQSGDVLASDLGKWSFAPTFRQPPDRRVPFPQDRWVRLRIHLYLSDKSDGAMEVWQDEIKVLDAHGQTLPTAKTIYDRLQVGLTANGSTKHEHTLYVDDLIISNQPLP